MRLLFSITVLLVLLSPTEAKAQQDQPIAVAVGAYRTRGIPRPAVRRLRATVANELRALGASIPPGAEDLKLKRRCFRRPKCLRRAAERVGVRGLIAFNARRAGPVVRVRMAIYDGATGLEVLQVKSSAKARRFPQVGALTADLERGLEALRQLDGAEEEAAVETETLAEEEVTEVETLSALPSPPLPPSPQPPVAETPTPDQVDGSDDKTDEGGLGPWPIVGWGTAGLGVVTLISGGVAGLVALNINGELRQDCPNGACPPEREGDIRTMYNLGTATPILLGAGGGVTLLGAVALVIMYTIGE